MPLFSIVIPTYGRPELLTEAISSVLAQTIEDFEIIIVDDGSHHEPRFPDDSRVNLIRLEANQGAARARNVGVKAATGDLLAFLDDDDVWTPRRLSFALTGLERAPVTVCWQAAKKGRMLEGNVHAHILESTTPSLGATALVRSAWIPLRETYRSCEDLAWWIEITRDARISTHPEQGLKVRRHGGARSGYGFAQRIRDSHRLMQDYPEYFHQYRGAAAFRWKQIGLMNLALDRRLEACQAFARAMIYRPTISNIWHLVRGSAGAGGW